MHHTTASAITLIHEMTHEFLGTEDFYDKMMQEGTLTNCEHIRAFVDKYKELCWRYSYAYEYFLKEVLSIAEPSTPAESESPSSPAGSSATT